MARKDESTEAPLSIEAAHVARGEGQRRVEALEPVIEEQRRRYTEIVSRADEAAEALVLHDGVILRDLPRCVVDEDVAIAEVVARVVVQK